MNDEWNTEYVEADVHFTKHVEDLFWRLGEAEGRRLADQLEALRVHRSEVDRLRGEARV